MPLDNQQKQAVRHITKQYLRIVSSKQRLLDYATGSERRSPEVHFVGDGLFTWWDAFMNANYPEAAVIFSPRELESIRRYDALIREFHRSSKNRELPIHEFVRTTTFEEISNAARHCYRAFRRFSIFGAS